jgi:cytidine deaminase
MIEYEMYAEAVRFMDERYGRGCGCVAVLRLDDGRLLTSVYTGDHNVSSVDLCAETGSICEAHKLNKKVTHSICVFKKANDKKYEILSPCGVCQERLRFWGKNVKVAVSNPKNAVIFKTLDELSPNYWLLGE